MVASGWPGWQPSDPDAGQRRETSAPSPAAVDAAVRQRVIIAAQVERIAVQFGREGKRSWRR